MITKAMPYFLVVVLMAALSACSKREPLVQVEAVPVNASAAVTLDKVGSTIIDAGKSKGWEMTKSGPREISGELFVSNKHTVNVRIPYNTEQYSILYNSSINMNYRKDTSVEYIHPKYNIWVRLLKQRIQERMAAN